MIAFLVLLPLEKLSVFLGIYVCMTGYSVGGERVFIAVLLELDNNSICFELLVSARHERVEG
jgi:hypothetical protein